MHTTRRTFAAALAAPLLAAGPRYHIGITTNTRGGWENDVWLSFREAREAGYTHVESFIHYFTAYWDKPKELRRRVEDMGLHFVTISNGGPLEMHFEDPARREKIVADHLRLVRLIRELGCTHLKINTGPRRPEGTTEADLAAMSATLDQLGRRISEEGLKFAVHAHMWSQLENRREIEYVLGHTDPRHVWFVLDTGHITMAGIDPVALARELGHRVVEFHLKDVRPQDRGGAKERVAVHEAMTNPVFFELGKGGVDFEGLKRVLDAAGWRGWMTVELDSSPFRPPAESARISRAYLRRIGIG